MTQQPLDAPHPTAGSSATGWTDPQSDRYLVINNLRKQFGGFTAVDGVSLVGRRGELVTLLGPSGCGKTTTLHCIAGIETLDEGEISIDGSVVSSSIRNINLPPEKRNVGMVFQSYALWPHLSVWKNVAYPLEVRRFQRREIKERVEQALEMAGLSSLAERHPTQLSGGQQQRVALARALVYSPKVLLLDEPLSNLDAQLREAMRSEIQNLQQKFAITAVYVTHDQTEAMAISDRVIVMRDGRIEQVGAPLDVYRQPVNRFVASFLGAANLIQGRIAGFERGSALVAVEVPGCSNATIVRARPQPAMQAGDRIAVCVRPHHLTLSHDGAAVGKENSLKGSVEKVVQLGSNVEYHVLVGQLSLRCTSATDFAVNRGDAAWLQFDTESSLCVNL